MRVLEQIVATGGDLLSENKKGVAGLEECSHEIAIYVRPLASRRVAPCLWLLATYIEKREASKKKDTPRNINQ